MEHGAWSMENGEWRMEHGEWRMENGATNAQQYQRMTEERTHAPDQCSNCAVGENMHSQ